MTIETRHCCDCGRPYPGDVVVHHCNGIPTLYPGWVLLQVSGRIRCPECASALDFRSLMQQQQRKIEEDELARNQKLNDWQPSVIDSGHFPQPDPEPERPFVSGGGGDYAGGGASGSWSSTSATSYGDSSSDSGSSSSSSDSSSSSSSSDSSSGSSDT